MPKSHISSRVKIPLATVSALLPCSLPTSHAMHPQSKDMVYVANGEVSSEDGIMEKIQRSISRTSAPEHLL